MCDVEASQGISSFNIVTSEEPGGNPNLRTNINAQQSTCIKAMVYKRNKFINRTNLFVL